jgi:thiamine-monophosphate kinase
LAVNLSDLAAMGAEPRLALLSLVLPDALEVAVVDGMLDGLLALAQRHRVTLVGGNISRSPGPLVVDVTASGTVRRRRVLTRAGARPGDEVYVTGAIGEGLVGLRSLQARVEATHASPLQACEGRYLRPEPRVRAGVLLSRTRAASACIDLSDGLADGVRQIAAASGVGIELDADALPMSPEVRRWHEDARDDPVAEAIGGGDDYELLFTARPAHRGRLRMVRRSVGDLPITRIGVVTGDRGVTLRSADGVSPLPGGFEHFR